MRMLLMNKAVPLAIIFLLAASGFYIFENSGSKFSYGGKITVYKSMSCGCCSVYASYLQKKGVDVNLPEISDEKLTGLKEQFSIPSALRSCHTTLVGDYFIEGHIPLEAIQKLLDEKPDIKGIAMPGMPSGSPGMPGAKTGPFVIYAVAKDGSSYEFMRI